MQGGTEEIPTKSLKIDSRIDWAGLFQIFIYDGDSRQLIQIDKKCRWQKFKKLEKILPRGVRGIYYTK
jgi:hypothetical protein